MSAVYFFIGCLLFFGIPGLITAIYATKEQEKLSAKIKSDSLSQFE